MKFRMKLRKISLRAALFALALVMACVIGIIGIPAFKTHQAFPAAAFPLQTYDLFDLGVADINSDNQLDAFTTNHSARQSLLLNTGKNLQFTDALSELKLDQDTRFPDLEDSLEKPELKEPGLYIYRYNRDLYFQPHQLNTPISGQLKLSWPIKIEVQTEATADIKAKPLLNNGANNGTASTLSFEIKPGGLLALKGEEDIIELPHTLSIDQALPTAQIFVGVKRIQPAANQFELMWRDRHSFAWSDLNQDQKMDVFVARGGVKGQLNEVPENITDEMMLMASGTYENKAEALGFEKKDCPGRQSAWVDFNRDNRLDLYVGCGRDDNPVHPNLLYQQQPNGKFIDVAASLGLDFPEDGAFRWLDFEADGDMDLLATKENAIDLYLQNKGEFVRTSIVEKFPAKILNLLLSDFDGDGDIDAYAESKYIDNPNLLLINDNQTYRPVNPAEIGLPELGLGASWVDYDNDGLTDFYSVPDGLYQQQPNHRFQANRLLSWHWRNTSAVEARSVWADIDNDGDRDLLSAVQQSPPLHARVLNRLLKLNLNSDWQKLWAPQLYSNQTRKNNWLELDLAGAQGNLQAIGATVTLKTAHTQSTQSVGSTDSSYFSQGHYRLYFGLGKDNVVSSLQIQWPNGQAQTIKNLAAGKIWKIKQNEPPVAIEVS
jgi:hypothetical protein